MKKVIPALAVALLAVFLFTAKSFALSETQSKIYNSHIAFLNKLKTCTPFEYSAGGLKIYGLSNGVCHFTQNNSGATVTNLKTNETISIGSCDYKVPLSTAEKYANINIKLTKAIYGIITPNQTELEKDMEYIFNLEKRYCK